MGGSAKDSRAFGERSTTPHLEHHASLTMACLPARPPACYLLPACLSSSACDDPGEKEGRGGGISAR